MFAKFYRNLTACIVAMWLVGCTSSVEQTIFNRSEAVKARINLALAYLGQFDYPKAKENIDKAIAHDPNDYLPHSVLAYYFQQIGEQDKAENTYKQALSLSQVQGSSHQYDPHILNNYGAFLCKYGRYSEAEQLFTQALESELPYYHQADTLENVALCANQARDNDRQQQALTQLEKLEPARASNLRAKLTP
ncbi:type IV pilus assembly protein PilF [Nicoletella semolina]|uniref:Type IV pilus assembly protein PilF n=1 Tax=Nicoletella semolina TaxID=271160 RepID=A0A4R2N571_9PAST|nr:type IV pilus biogenesis/stability protein PilW [Nicoletella semolina]MDH2924783.1 type IV pilus biogenesis/stability protein PilW [Nicoletella semolina]TCP16000.1 type IV pilus assembly protein PilF [Nicoletella semolina]